MTHLTDPETGKAHAQDREDCWEVRSISRIARRRDLSSEISFPFGFDGFDRANMPLECWPIRACLQKVTISASVASLIAREEKVGQAPGAEVVLVEMRVHIRATIAGEERLERNRHVADSGRVP